jgi:hypothetical protein
MSEGQSQRSVASSVQHRQEDEVAAAEECKRAAAETAATATRAARLAMAKLAVAREEVEAAAAVDAARAAAAELEALHASSTGSSVSADDDRDNELKLVREAAREQAAQWAAVHPQGVRRGGSPNGRGHAGGAPGGGARGGRALDGGGSTDMRGCAGGWFDGDRGLYRRRGSPSPDRYHGHHEIQAIVRDVGPDGGWPTLTKTNYVEWATVMRVWLQVRHMWEPVRYSDVDYYEDRRALDALIAAVPSEMQFSLSKKRTAKEAWDAIAAARIGSDRTRKTTLQALCKEWENLA